MKGKILNSKFNEIFIDEEFLNGFQIIDLDWDNEGFCKRCGKRFTKKYREQTFCSSKCRSIYKIKMQNMQGKVNKQGQTFEEWLNDSIDYSYSPEKLEEF